MTKLRKWKVEKATAVLSARSIVQKHQKRASLMWYFVCITSYYVVNGMWLDNLSSGLPTHLHCFSVCDHDKVWCVHAWEASHVLFNSVNHVTLRFRKQWVKSQQTVHSCGEDEDELDAEDLQELEQHMYDGTIPHHFPACSESLTVLTLSLVSKMQMWITTHVCAHSTRNFSNSWRLWCLRIMSLNADCNCSIAASNGRSAPEVMLVAYAVNFQPSLSWWCM